MSFEIEGKIEELYPEQQITEKFKKREFVLEIQNGMYPEYVKFQLTQDRCSLMDGYNKGDVVKVSFNLKGRPYNKDGKTIYFTNVEAWRVENSGGASSSSGNSGGNPSSQTTPQAETKKSGNSNDLSGMSFSEATEDELPF